jgi:site-specific recombinase XerD
MVICRITRYLCEESSYTRLQEESFPPNCVFHDNGEKLYSRKVQRAFVEALRVAKIEDFHFHDLRHSFASRLVQSGVDIYAVQKLLGHKDGRMTQRYAHLSIENLRSAISNMKNGYVLVTSNEGKGVAPCATL